MAIGLKDIHIHSIAHYDIKHKNIFLSNCSENPTVKIADFGLACNLPEDERFEQGAGTLGYKSPEIIQIQPSNFSADIWSLGVILYELLCGEMPFHGSDINDVKHKILNKELSYTGKRWSAVSEECIELVKNMLCKDPEARYDIADVILHPCLAHIISETDF